MAPEFARPPDLDEFEISVIGPGRGECVILHLGNNEWCIIDSCISPGSSDSAAVKYLNSFGNGALDGVKLVIATHWHDDHIRGLASILRRVPTAAFCCSGALQQEGFAELVGAASDALPRQSGVDEFAAILGLLETTQLKEPRRRVVSPKWAVEHRELLNLSAAGRPFSATVKALSPSDATLTIAFGEIARLLPKAGETPRSVPNITPNHTSVVVWVEVGPWTALLGADLIHNHRAGEGWMAVVACHQNWPRAEFFKVPHHGSQNADYPQVWTQMLAEDPIAVVTPFNSVPLPKKTDLRRLSGRTTRLYCTAKSSGKKPVRSPLVEKFLRRQLADRRIIDGSPGHVRVRWSLSNPRKATIEPFQGAYQVTAA